MEIHILLAGVEFGPYTDDKARELVADGFLAATDPAKRLDETEWIPLTEVLARPPQNGAEETPHAEEPFDFREEEPAPEEPVFPTEPALEEEPEAAESWPELSASEPEPEPEIVPPAAPVKPTATVVTAPKPAAPAPSVPMPVTTAAPSLVNITVPSRAKGKGATRTGSLLMKEALEAARSRVGASSPAALTAPLPERADPVSERAAAFVPALTISPSSLTKTRTKIVLMDREQEEPPAPKARQTIRLSGPISIGSAAAPESKKPALQAPERTFTTGKILVGQFTSTMPLSSTRKSSPLKIPTILLPEPRETPPEAAPFPSDSDVLPEPSAPAMTASGELAEKRSLKITGALKQPTTRTPVRLTTGFTFKKGDSGNVVLRTEEGQRPPSQPLSTAKVWGPESPASRPIFSPTSRITPPSPPMESPRLDIRPPSTKIPVSEMPPEGLKVRSTRRLTGRVTLPEAPKLPPEIVPAPEPAVETIPLKSDEPVVIAAPTEIAETLAAPPEILPPEAPPEKVRLRRPVKLELSSRTKLEDSGRLTLETFSKMGAGGPPKVTSLRTPALDQETPARAPRPGTPTEEGEATALLPPEMRAAAETVPLATVEEMQPPRLSEIKVPKKRPSLADRRQEKWLWVAYAIIALGMLAWLLLLYLATHRRAAVANTVTPTAAATAPAVATAPPAVEPASPTPPETEPTPAAPPTDMDQQVAAYVSDGKSSFQKGDLDSALAAFNHALDLNPRSADALYNRGLTKAQQDDSDGAISDFSQALQVDPKLAGAYYARGLARHAKNDLDGALADYNLAVQTDPKLSQAFLNRGLIRMQKDDIDGAIVDSGRALELDSRLIQSYYNRGLGRLAKGALDAALSDMKTFCTLAPQDSYTDYARLYIWLIRTQQGQLAEANQELSQEMNSGWNGSADSMVTRIGEFLLGQIAENDLIAAAASPIPLKEQGQHCEAWYFIGMRRLEAGDKESAAVDLRKCVETQKTDYCEYILAQEQLKTLNPGSAVTSDAPVPAPAK